MSPKKRNQRLLGYTRVSRMKDGGISPELQRQAIEAYVIAHGHEVIWLEPDLDESGSKLDRPAMKDALARLERGEADGIIAARLDRFTRRVADLGELLDLAKEQDWNLVAIDLGVDLTTANGRMVANILGNVAEWELNRRRESWRESRGHAVDRGIHVTSTLPAGYDREPDTRRLVPNKDAPAIRKAFEVRAQGASWAQVAAHLNDAGVRTSHAGRKLKIGNGTNEGLWRPDGVERLLRNRVYLGEARSGEFVQPNAHEAIVSPGLFARVQGRRQKGDYTLTRETLMLTGHVRCATCESSMRKDSTRRDGKVYDFMRCKNALCSARATIGVRLLEDFVADHLVGFLQARPEGLPLVSPAYRPAGDDQHLVDALLEAEEELRLYAATTSVTAIGAEAFRAGLEARQAAVEEARRAVHEATPSAWPPAEWAELEPVIGDVITVGDEGKLMLSGDAVQAWWERLEPHAKNQFLGALIHHIDVKPGRKPVGERVKIVSLRGR